MAEELSRAEILLDALDAAAKAGSPCPANHDLGALIDRNESGAQQTIKLLEDTGRIEVLSVGNAKRRIRIVDSGDITAPTTRGDCRSRLPTTTRLCLMCCKDFRSTGAHHRVCDTCKGTLAWRSGAT